MANEARLHPPTWAFRYSHEGLHLWNLPFQLCDVTLWMRAPACLTLSAPVVALLGFAAAIGTLNAVAGTNFMYLARKPENASALDVLEPWPWYLAAGAAIALVLFWALWLPLRPLTTASSRRNPRLQNRT